MHRLERHHAYLAGPIDDIQDRGVGWRKDITKFLNKLKIGVLCPINKPIGTQEDEGFLEDVNSLKEQGRFEEAYQIMKDVVADDYRMVDKADFVILYIDRDAHMCGSYHESALAVYQRKPVIICCKQGVENVPNWLFGMCKYQMFFNDWNKVKEYIEHICYDAKVECHNRWKFFDNNRIYNESTVDSGLRDQT